MTLKIFQKCDDKYDWQAYVRFGLYYVMRNGSRTNFCDIHLGWTPGNALDLGVFSGPKDSTNQITRHQRSAEAAKRYRVELKVNSDLVLTSGGVAKIIYSTKRKTYDLWLFGPLLFNDLPYGSLVAELRDLRLPKVGHKFTPIDPKTGKERDSYDPKSQRYIVNFPKNYGLHFHPCNLKGCDYADGLTPSAPGFDYIIRDGGSTVHWEDDHGPGEKYYEAPGPAPDLMTALHNARPTMVAAALPKDAIRVEWKVEQFLGDQTVCQVYNHSG